jgi:hypothetical protein
MSNHTPGEWWFNPDGDESSTDPTVEGPNGPIASIHHITRVVGEGRECHVEYGHFEDGHLIASAPDLLAACEELANAKDLLGFFGAQLHAREAIKKAKGESS